MHCLFKKWPFTARGRAGTRSPHAQSCPKCRPFFQAAEALDRALETPAAGPAPSPDFHNRIMKGVCNAAAERADVVPPTPPPRLRFALAGVAAVAVMVAALLLFPQQSPPPLITSQPSDIHLPPAMAESLPALDGLALARSRAEFILQPIETEFEDLKGDLRRAAEFGWARLQAFAALPPDASD
jgi:hypothetical protein